MKKATIPQAKLAKLADAIGQTKMQLEDIKTRWEQARATAAAIGVEEFSSNQWSVRIVPSSTRTVYDTAKLDAYFERIGMVTDSFKSSHDSGHRILVKPVARG